MAAVEAAAGGRGGGGGRWRRFFPAGHQHCTSASSRGTGSPWSSTRAEAEKLRGEHRDAKDALRKLEDKERELKEALAKDYGGMRQYAPAATDAPPPPLTTTSSHVLRSRAHHLRCPLPAHPF